MTNRDRKEIERKRKAIEAETDAYAAQFERADANKARQRREGMGNIVILGKRAAGAKQNYRKTAPATAKTTAEWANRGKSAVRKAS